MPIVNLMNGEIETKTELKNEINSVKNWAAGTFNNPNMLINGDFQVWQRGTNLSVKNKSYSADRWQNSGFGDGNVTVSRNINTSSAPVKHSLKIVRESAEGPIWLSQPLENYSIYAGRKLTASFYIRGANGFSGNFLAIIGSSASFTIELTQDWQYVSFTRAAVFDDASVAKQGILFASLGSNPAMAGQGIELAAVKLELGEVATQFLPENYGHELAKCQRYFINYGTIYGAVRSVNIIDGHHYYAIFLPCALRAIPTLNFGETKVRRIGSLENLATELSITGRMQNILVLKAALAETKDTCLVIDGLTVDAEIY